jgi:beta-lactamase superfamily II metal-dependent hydrolase
MIGGLTDTQESVRHSADPTILNINLTEARTLSGIRVFDVGQGDCIGLLDEDQRIFCYVDYGGLADNPYRGTTMPNPAAQRMPPRSSGGGIQIILTHWDKDHYYTAKKYNTFTADCPWLVPRQMASPQAVRFAASLSRALCWPETYKQKTKQFRIGAKTAVEIRKCGQFIAKAPHEDRNRTGLAVTLLHYENDKCDRYMLLPGDCPFDRIPMLPKARLQVLVAYHHGAHTHWGKSTQVIKRRAKQRYLVYSYGRSNIYGHPDPTNYEPQWDAFATHTPHVPASTGYEDFLWEFRSLNDGHG